MTRFFCPWNQGDHLLLLLLAAAADCTPSQIHIDTTIIGLPRTPTSGQASGAPPPRSGSSSSSSYSRMEWVPLPPPINPLAAVRRTTASVLQNANHVSLNGEAVEQLAKMWAVDGGAGGASVGWNETGWHYSEDAASGGSMTCQYVFVLGELISILCCSLVCLVSAAAAASAASYYQ